MRHYAHEKEIYMGLVSSSDSSYAAASASNIQNLPHAQPEPLPNSPKVQSSSKLPHWVENRYNNKTVTAEQPLQVKLPYQASATAI